jgi:hypothetical protein
MPIIMAACAIGIWIAPYTATADFAPNLAVDTHLTAFVHLLHTRYGLAYPQSTGSQPLHAGELARMFASADSLDSTGVLAPYDAHTLHRLRKKLYRTYDVYGWHHDGKDVSTHINANIHTQTEATAGDEATAVRLHNTFNPTMAGHVHRFSYWYAMDIATVTRLDSMFHQSDFEPYKGIPYLLPGRLDSSATKMYSLLRGGINYNYTFFRIEAGVDRFRQGPCLYHPLTFSGNAPPVTYVRLRLDFWRTQYIHTVAQLNSQRDKGKYLYTHRWRFPGWNDRLVFGVGEALVNGSVTEQQPPCDDADPCAGTAADTNSVAENLMGNTRGWELRYMIPFVPYTVAQQVYGDQGNTLLFFDISLRYPDTWRWYAEFLLDDINVGWPPVSDDFGDKWGLTLGMQHTFSLGGFTWAHAAEYSRIEPWVYTHYYGGSHRFTHFGTSLGSPLGPNSEAFTWTLHQDLLARLRLGIRLDNVRKNEDARGGSIIDVYQNNNDEDTFTDAETKQFLGKHTRRRTDISLQVRVTPLQRYTLQGHLGFRTTNFATQGLLAGCRATAWF